MCKAQGRTDKGGEMMFRKMIKNKKIVVWAIVIAMIVAMVVPLAVSVA